MPSIVFDHIVKKISNAKAAADALATHTKHKGITGSIREIALKQCIEPFLT